MGGFWANDPSCPECLLAVSVMVSNFVFVFEGSKFACLQRTPKGNHPYLIYKVYTYMCVVVLFLGVSIFYCGWTESCTA